MEFKAGLRAYRQEWKCSYCKCEMTIRTPFGMNVLNEYCPECGSNMELIKYEEADNEQ